MPKKKVNKPLRAVATTSVASKKQLEDARLAKEAVEAERAAKVVESEIAEQASMATPTDVHSGDGSPETPDWEKEDAVEQSMLQSIVDRLHDKGEKEVNRIMKSIEYDTRLSSALPTLSLPEGLQEEILHRAASEDEHDDKAVERSSKQSTSGDEDTTLLRLYVSHGVLSRLGFAEGRIVQCLTEGVRLSDGWVAALEWMWLHLSEDECLARGEHDIAKVPESEIPTDAPLLPEAEVTASVPVSSPARVDSPTKGPAPISFKRLDDDSSDSDSDADLDLRRLHERWAENMLSLENLRTDRVRKKSNKRQPCIETPDMRKLKESIVACERQYLFDRKEADSILKILRARSRASLLEARLRQKDSPANGSDIGESLPDDLDGGDGSDRAADSSDDEDGIFGGLLDEPESNDRDDAQVIMPIRALSIPKTFSFSGNTPKSLLRHALDRSDRPASTLYVKLSGQSRAVRVGLELLWASGRRRVWRMDDFACNDLVEAENYVSILALNELHGNKDVPAPNWRTMPPDCRQLWEELERNREQEEQAGRRALWTKIRDIRDVLMRSKLAEATSFPSSQTKSTTSTAEDVKSATPLLRDDALQADFGRRQTSTAYQTMYALRQKLPIASFRSQIIQTLGQSQVVVLSGETGCGKSTQLPSYILEDQLSKGQRCKIFVTEPRRISAISLAQRVSQELGENKGVVGTPGSLVGYSIRLEAKMAPSTRLAFVTNGIALRMLEAGSGGRRTAFDEVTHIVVDEVHERSIESDFLLIVLKQLIEQRPDLKVVLMSATLDADKISAFFGGCPTLSVPGRTYPVQVNYLEDAVELAQYRIDQSSRYAVRGRFTNNARKQLEWDEAEVESAGSDSDTADKASDPARLSSSRYSIDTVNTVNLLDSRQIPYDLIVRLLERICFDSAEHRSFAAATLIFMPGLAEIRKLNDILSTHQLFGNGEFVIYPLHSTISSEGQGAVFDVPPRGMRKIVISTNIAETGVTIPDVTCVIDCGKHREMRYDERRQVSRLIEAYISRDNAKQRRGRAGRVQEGLAFHLFTRARHDNQMAPHAVPEMLRLSLQDLALRIKVLKVKLGNSIEDVLSKALDPPSSLNIQRAVASLVEVKALTANEDLTAMGRLLSKLPMDVHLGKFLLVASCLKCLDPALTIAATLNSKSPFVTPFGFETQADAAKKSFAVGNSDFLTLANVFASWRRASENPQFVKTFCRKNYLSHQNLQQIEELRQQLLSYLVDSSVVTASAEEQEDIRRARNARGYRTRFVAVPAIYDANSDNPHVVTAALAAGLYPKLLNLNVNGLQTISNQQPVSLHPSSVNVKVQKADFGTNYLIYFTIMQSKKLYAWETGPVHDGAIALLCGDSPDFRIPACTLVLDRVVRYRVHPRTAVAIKTLRRHLTAALADLMKGKMLDESGARWLELGIQCLGLRERDNTGPPIGLALEPPR